MPKVSVVILNWNGKQFLDGCLGSLEKVRYKPFEVILVDNNSSDGSVAYVTKKFPWVTLVPQSENQGFARGNNIGFGRARGKYIFFLNNDTRVTPGFLEPLVETLEQDARIGCLQPQIRLMDTPDCLDQVGSYQTSTGYLYHFGFHKPYDNPSYQMSAYMFCAKGAAMLIPKTVLEKVGLFDEDYHIFFEETDLCHRIWLGGYTVQYEPRSVIYHKTGGDTVSTFGYSERVYLSVRNMLVTYLKNFGTRNLFTVMPFTGLMHTVLVVIFSLRRRFDLVWAIVRAYEWNARHLRKILAKRRRVQRDIRKISDAQLNELTLKNPRLSYYYYLLTDLRKYRD